MIPKWLSHARAVGVVAILTLCTSDPVPAAICDPGRRGEANEPASSGAIRDALGLQQSGMTNSDAFPITTGQEVTGQLAPGDQQDEHGRYRDLFVFQAPAGETVTIEVESDEFDARVVVEFPRGVRVLEDNDGGIGRNARVVVSRPEGETLSLWVSSYGEGEMGTYRLKLHAGEAALPQGGVKAELDEQYYRRALEIARMRGRMNQEPRLIRGVADALVGQAKNQEALSCYDSALKKAKQTHDRREEQWAHGGAGRAFAELGQIEAAVIHLELALALAQEAGDLEGEGLWLGSLGTCYWRKYQLEQAIEYYDRGLTIARETKDRRNEGRWLGYIGIAQRNLGRYDLAVEYYEQALTISREIKNRQDEGRWLGNLGNVYWNVGLYEQMIEYYQQALAIAHEINDRRAIGAWLGNIGYGYHSLGQPQRSLEYYEQALVVAREVENRSNEGYWLGNMGDAYLLMGQPARAAASYEQALGIAQEVKDPRLEIRWLVDLGQAYERLNRIDRAIAYYEQALANVRKTKNRINESRCLGYIGNAYGRLGYFERAREAFEQALTISKETRNPEGEAHWLTSLGGTYSRLGQTEQARTTFQQALSLPSSVGDPREWAIIHHELARMAQQQNQPDRAEAEFEAARTILENVRREVKVEESKTAFFAGTQEFYHDYTACLLSRDQVSRGFEMAEAARARSLLDLLAETRINIDQGIDPALNQRRRFVQARISWIQSQLIQVQSSSLPDRAKISQWEHELKLAEEQLEGIQREIRNKHPEYAELQYPVPLSLASIQNQLDDRTALLEYALGDEKSFLFVVGRTEVHSFQLPSAGEIARLVRGIRTVFREPVRRLAWQKDLNTYIHAAQQLYDLLVAPAANVLSGKSNLLIVPDGALYYLPFEALLLTDVKGRRLMRYQSLPYLLDRWTVSYTPSASTWASLRRRRTENHAGAAEPGGKRFLAFADPEYEVTVVGREHLDSKGPGDLTKPSTPRVKGQTERQHGADNWQELTLSGRLSRGLIDEGERWMVLPLVNARREVVSIAKRYDPEEVSLFLGSAAREENVKHNPDLIRSRWIHFATHGVIDEEKPQYSGLVLTLDNDPQEDGLLQVHEIFNLKLNADMVVLSACRSGLGKEMKGEGMIGLTRAFLYAGAASVVVSLWDVKDNSTPRLMETFYRRLDRSKHKADSLRLAKLNMIRNGEHAHPFFWASFVLVGEQE